jgi:hypothetical protein|tara:strand:- start:9272 stop:9469 length:198 start_codon:yes stop_codon:yes gene_type:complete
MKLQTLDGIDKTMGGRPTIQFSKRRHSFYLNPKESELLKEYSRKHDITVSELVRKMIKQIVEVKP